MRREIWEHNAIAWHELSNRNIRVDTVKDHSIQYWSLVTLKYNDWKVIVNWATVRGKGIAH